MDSDLVILVERTVVDSAPKLTGSQSNLLIFVEKGKVHEVLNSVELGDDFFHLEFHDGGDTLDYPPVDFLAGEFALCLVPGVDLLSDVEKHIKVLVHARKNDVRVCHQQHVYRIYSVLHNLLVVVGRY